MQQIGLRHDVEVNIGSDTAELVIDSADAVGFDEPPTRVLVGSEGSGLLMRKINRASIQSIEMQYQIPNVNPTNNQLIVWVKGITTAPRTITMTPGFFHNPLLLINKIIGELNSDATVGTAAGLTWINNYTGTETFPEKSMFKLRATNTAVPTTIYPVWFDPECSAVKYGAPLWNFPKIPAAVDTVPNKYNKVSCDDVIIGPIYCQYTRFVDFHSTRLLQWTKNPPSSTKFGSNSLLQRVYLDPWKGYEQNPVITESPLVVSEYPELPCYIKHEDSNLSWFYMKPDEALNMIDVYLTDEFGRDLYVPRQEMTITGYSFYEARHIPVGNNGGLRWSVTLACEL